MEILRTIQSDSNQFIKIKFGDICRNIAIRVDNPKEAGTDYYVGLEHLEPLELRIKNYGSPDEVIGTKLRFKSGQILFGKRRFYQKKLAIAERDGICSAHMLVLEAISDHIVPSFLPLLMQGDHFYQKALMISEGSLSPTIKWKNLAKQEFLIPSKQIQQKIVNIISVMDNSYQTTESLLQKTIILKKVTMNQLLTKGIGHVKFKQKQINLQHFEMIPEEWQVMPLRNLVVDIKTGFAEGKRNENGIIQLRMNNISEDGMLNFQKTLKVPIPENIKEFDLKMNDVLFNNTNSLDLIGKSVLLEQDLDVTFSNHLTRIRTNAEKLNPRFLVMLLHKYKNENLFKAICHTHVGQSGIGKDELQQINIVCPDLLEQHKIASILQNIDEQINTLKEYLTRLKQLRMNMLNLLLIPHGEKS